MTEVCIPTSIYPLIADMRRSFEQILSILQDDESRIREGFQLLQSERDRMAADLLARQRTSASCWTASPPEAATSSLGRSPAPHYHDAALMEEYTPHEKMMRHADEGHVGEDDVTTSATGGGPGGATEVSLNQRMSPARDGTDSDADYDRERPRLLCSPSIAGDRPSPVEEATVRDVRPPRTKDMISPPPRSSTDTHHDRPQYMEDDTGVVSSPLRQERTLALISQSTSQHRDENCTGIDCEDGDSGGRGEPAPDDLPHTCSESHLPMEAQQGTATHLGNAPPGRSLSEELRVYAVPVAPFSMRYDQFSGNRAPQAGCVKLSETKAGRGGVAVPHNAGFTALVPSNSYSQRLDATAPHSAALKRVNGAAADPTATMELAMQKPQSRSQATCTTRQRHVLRIKSAQGFWIHVWPCFGTYSASARPARVYVYAHCRHLEDITEQASQELCCKPAPQYMFYPDGKVVKSLRDLIPEQHYLLFPSGGFYREEAVPAALLRLLVKSAKETLADRSF